MWPGDSGSPSAEAAASVAAVRPALLKPRAAVLACCALVLSGAACTDSDGDDDPQPPDVAGSAPSEPAKARAPVRRSVEMTRVGRGARGAVVLHPSPAPADPPVVVFLHGWGLTRVADYRGWLRHLAKRGNVVIFPRYQLNEGSDPGRARVDALAGVRSALRRFPASGPMVVAGHSAGGALAADYAAVSDRARLPRPRAVFSVYPGRAILGYPGGIPAANLRAIAPDTRLVVMAGAGDTIVGQAPARELVRQAGAIPRNRRRFVLVGNPRVADHFAPTRRSRAARRTFWRRLDVLIAQARR